MNDGVNKNLETGVFDMLKEIFKDTETDDSTLQSLRETATFHRYPAGVVLCHEGKIENTFYLLVRGYVDVYRSESGQSFHVDTLREGSCFGEIALILNAPRTADIVTAIEVDVLEITRDNFNTLIRTQPEALLGVSQLILQRMLRQEMRRLHQMSFMQQGDAEEPRIFISYARKDEAFVRELATDLQKRKIYTWVDVFRIKAGRSWAQQIGRALDQCQYMLLIVTPAALNSENVDDEWNYFLDLGKPIIPVLLKPANIPYRMRKMQYVDFINHDYDHALDDLIANLNAIATQTD